MKVLRRVWGLVRWFVILEIGIWRSLALWIARRVSGQGEGVEAFTYARQISPIIGAFIFVSAIELPVVHLLLPWETIRLVVDVLSVWGLLCMVGLLASMRVFPHLMDEHGLRIRNGTTVDIRVPWSAIASVTGRRGSVASGKGVVVERGDGGAVVVAVPVMKLTRIEIELHAPTTLQLPDGPLEITRLRCYADDPARFAARAREHLSADANARSGDDASACPPPAASPASR